MPIPVEFTDQNPWWRDKEALEKDKQLATLANSKVSWEPRIKYRFSWSKDVIYTLRGPRQIGKTTLLKVFIRDLVAKGVNPRKVFYHTCDLVANPKELTDIILSYVDSVRQDHSERLFIFLDEISSVRDWQKGIKHLVDIGKLSLCTVILTGSHTIDLKRAYEKLPGRRGETGEVADKIMLPMKFSEYTETLSKEIASAIREQNLLSSRGRQKCFESLLQGLIPKEVEELNLYHKELGILFKDYTITGGIPRVIDEYLKNGSVSEGLYKTFVDVVLGDLTRWNKREPYLRQIISRVADTLGTPVGWNTIKNETDIAHHNTVAEYVDTLRDAFVLIYLNYLDIGRGRASFAKEKKIHFHDPFFLHAMRAWVTGGEPFSKSLEFIKDTQKCGALVEGIVADHLVRLAFSMSSQKQLFDQESVVFYWKSSKKREVDFILKLENGRYAPVEVKYQERVSRQDKFGIMDFQKTRQSAAGLLLSRGRIDIKGNIVTMPIWLFLLLI